MQTSSSGGHHHPLSFAGVLVTLGIIYGDIGTSPLYAIKAIIGPNVITQELVLGGISAVFWTITILTSIKYVYYTLKADNKGEGGILSLFALIKKEVSVHFVAEVLDENEEDILDFINTYASWFNSPEPGKFQLYHERLKVYLLQKLSEQEVAILNDSIVYFLERNVKEEKVNESVLYCFEFLSFHLFFCAYLYGKKEPLARYCLDDNFKKRQFESLLQIFISFHH
jgi:hypothetical protein